jgi:hypothetical protein
LPSNTWQIQSSWRANGASIGNAFEWDMWEIPRPRENASSQKKLLFRYTFSTSCVS